MGKSDHTSYCRAMSTVGNGVSVGVDVMCVDEVSTRAIRGIRERNPPLGRYGFPVRTNDTGATTSLLAYSVASVRFSTAAMMALWEYPNTARGVCGLLCNFSWTRESSNSDPTLMDLLNVRSNSPDTGQNSSGVVISSPI